MDAVKTFEDNTLDFVYIDGDHQWPSVVLDLYWWHKKVRKGGIVAGHDYGQRHTHVKQAVDGFVAAYGISPVYLTDEKIRSFFWVK